jgi:hypothetical protein
MNCVISWKHSGIMNLWRMAIHSCGGCSCGKWFIIYFSLYKAHQDCC